MLSRATTSSTGTITEQVLVYLRISEDRTGEEAGVERQRDDCLSLCARLGLDVAEPDVFMDNDTSAYLDKKRPDFARMLARIKLGPSRVVVWHVDRLYRRPRELEDLIDLVETHPIRIEAVMGGAFDLNTHEGRLMARQLVAMAAYESGHKADRIRRANRQKAERGDWHGAAKFGYGTGGVLIPEQAAVVREMADRFLAGQSLRSITAWLNDESGFPAPQAKTGKTLGVWHATTVKSILVSARISGQRAYEPTRRRGDGPNGREILGPGNWPAIITPEETTRIRAMLSNPDRRVGASSINLLSAIATCGKCGSGARRGQGQARAIRCEAELLPLHASTRTSRERRSVCQCIRPRGCCQRSRDRTPGRDHPSGRHSRDRRGSRGSDGTDHGRARADGRSRPRLRGGHADSQRVPRRSRRRPERRSRRGTGPRQGKPRVGPQRAPYRR